jgi:hypothetical protein
LVIIAHNHAPAISPATLLTPEGGKWKLNLVEGESVRILLRGRDVFARPDMVSDPTGD